MAKRGPLSAIAVGVGNYDYLPRLYGPEGDVAALRNLLCGDARTALLAEDRFYPLVDVDAATVRTRLVEYAYERSASGDTLLFFFSGHAAPLPDGDLALCMKDARRQDSFGVLIPASTLRFSEVIETLALVHVSPVVIIDACYSGQAGSSAQQLYSRLNEKAATSRAGSYALLCSSARTESTLDMGLTGSFTRIFTEVAGGGLLDSKKPELSLQDLFPKLRTETERRMGTDSQLFLGPTLPAIAIVKNALYRTTSISLTKGHLDVLTALWNNGDPQVLEVSDFQKLGSTAHTTYSKLGYAPAWALVESVDRTRRKLTDRGLSFMRGEVSIPYSISQIAESSEWQAAVGSRQITFHEWMDERRNA